MFPKNLATSGQYFVIQKNSEQFRAILVLNQGQPRIDYENHVNLVSGDWIINSSGQRLFITQTFNLSQYYKSSNYITEYEYNLRNQNSTVYNINANSIDNSIIGNQSNAVININTQLDKIKSDIENSSSTDKEELLKIVKLLEEIISKQEPVKKGFLYKFSEVLQRNSWITGSIASLLLNMFLSQ